MVFKRNPDVRVVRVALGLSAWLAEPLRWARGGTAAVLEAVLAEAPAGGNLWFRTSLLPQWKPLGGSPSRRELVDAVSASWSRGRPRHFLSVEVADDPQVRSFGLAYTEIDEGRAARPSSLELTLPQDSDPSRLAALARKLLESGPVLCAIGGYAARWNPAHERLGFAQIRVWCKRYLGLDVQDLEEMAWRVPAGLPGSNWLNFIGHALADRLKLDLRALANDPWLAGTEAKLLPGGLSLTAGALPALGDANRGEFPSAYAEVARRLAPAFVKEPPPFRGGFHEHEGTLAWLRRLVEPEGWQ